MVDPIAALTVAHTAVTVGKQIGDIADTVVASTKNNQDFMAIDAPYRSEGTAEQNQRIEDNIQALKDPIAEKELRTMVTNDIAVRDIIASSGNNDIAEIRAAMEAGERAANSPHPDINSISGVDEKFAAIAKAAFKQTIMEESLSPASIDRSAAPLIARDSTDTTSQDAANTANDLDFLAMEDTQAQTKQKTVMGHPHELPAHALHGGHMNGGHENHHDTAAAHHGHVPPGLSPKIFEAIQGMGDDLSHLKGMFLSGEGSLSADLAMRQSVNKIAPEKEGLALVARK